MSETNQSGFDPGREHLGEVYAQALLGATEKAAVTEAVVAELGSFVEDILDKLPQIQATLTTPLPRDSLDGEIDTTVATLKLSSRPWERFFWNASYRYDDRDNDTPRDRYVYVGGDTQIQATSASSDRIRFNDPYSYKDQQIKLEGGYRIFADNLRRYVAGEPLVNVVDKVNGY